MSHYKEGLLRASLALDATCLVVFFVLSLIYPIGNIFLFASMLVSKTLLLFLHSKNKVSYIIYYQIFFLLTFFSFLNISKHVHHLRIDEIVIFSNFLPTLGLFTTVLMRSPRVPQSSLAIADYKLLLKSVPGFAGTTLVNNFYLNALPFFASSMITVYDLGLLRVTLSALQVCATLFPIPSRVILYTFISLKNKKEFLTKMLSASLFFFSIMGIGVCMAAFWKRELLKFMGLFAIVPVYYWTILLERFSLANGRKDTLIWINISILLLSLIFFKTMTNIESWKLLYAVGFSIYLFCLVHANQVKNWFVFVVIPISLLGFFASRFWFPANMGLSILLFIIAVSTLKAKPKSFRNLISIFQI